MAKCLFAVKSKGEFVGLVEEDDLPGVLMIGHVAPAVFYSREAANSAIRKSLRYAKKQGYDWSGYKIVRLWEEQEAVKP